MKTSKKTKWISFIVISICIQGLLLISCGSSEPDPPKLIDCNEFTYDGNTYNACHCESGVKSFDCSTSEDNNKYTFHIECKNACITSVSVIKKNTANNVVTSPE